MNEVDERLLSALDACLDWTEVLERGSGATIAQVFDVRTIEVGDGDCSHEDCYETHDIYVILEINCSYFRKSGTVNSMDGNRWEGPLRGVRVQQVTKRMWEAL